MSEFIGKLLVILFFAIICAVRCTFFEELKEVYVKNVRDSPQKTENDAKLIKLHQKLLKAKCTGPSSEGSSSRTRRRKRRKIKEDRSSELAVGVMLTYLTHALRNIHGVTKRMALKRHYLHGGNIKRRKSWRLNKWARTYATLKRKIHDEENNDGQYKFLERYRTTERNNLFWHLSDIPEIKAELKLVCVKLMQHIFESRYDPSFISDTFTGMGHSISFHTANFRHHGLHVYGGTNCMYKSPDEKVRFSFHIVALPEPQNYFAILDEFPNFSMPERIHHLMVEYRTNLLDIVKLSDDKNWEDISVIFDVVNSEESTELADLTDPNTTNVASARATVNGPSEPQISEIVVIDDDLAVIDDDLVVIDDHD